MAIVFTEGFDLYSSSTDLNKRGWTTGSASMSAMQTGRFTGRAARFNSGNNTAMIRGITSTDSITIGIAVKAENLGGFTAGGERFAVLRNGSTDLLYLTLTNDGKVRVFRVSGSAVIATTAAGAVASGAWAYLEFEILRHASAGTVSIYVNGSLAVAATGLNSGASSFDVIGLMGGSTNIDFDDMYVTNTTSRLGEMQIETIRASADTATKQFTRSTGADNYANVDDSQNDDDTTYNYSQTVGQKDLFDLADLSSTPSTVKAVSTIILARKDNSTTRSVRTNMKNGATTTNGTTRSLGSSYQYYEDIYETNPDTAAAFSGAAVNAMQLGYELVA